MRAMLSLAFAALTAISCQTLRSEPPPERLRFAVSFSGEHSTEALDGRLLLMISTRDDVEPRFSINDGPKGQQIFGIDVEGLRPGEPAIVDRFVLGYPRGSLDQIEPGDYWVQALLHRYETFRRSDGHVVKLPMDRGEGQQWNRAPGNLLSVPQRMTLIPKSSGVVEISLSQEIPAIEPPQDSRYIKHISIQSKLLTEFWGRPMELGACVLLPHGFDEHPEARYPLVVNHGHFPQTFGGLPRDAARPGPAAGLQRALPAPGLQQDPAAVGL